MNRPTDIVQQIKGRREYRPHPLPTERPKTEIKTLDLQGMGGITIIKPTEEEMRRTPAMLIAGVLYAILHHLVQWTPKIVMLLEQIAAQGVQVIERPLSTVYLDTDKAPSKRKSASFERAYKFLEDNPDIHQRLNLKKGQAGKLSLRDVADMLEGVNKDTVNKANKALSNPPPN
jgi:hypothetical protein